MSEVNNAPNFSRIFNDGQPLNTAARMEIPQMDLDAREFQRMITDEKLRNEEHRRNFRILKTEYEDVSNQLRCLQTVNRQLMDQQHEMQDNYQKEIQNLKKEIFTKDAEIEETKSKSVIPNLGMLKLNIQEEIEKAYRERFSAAEEESERLRMECNKLKYDLAYIKTNAEHVKESSQHMQEELTLKYQGHIATLEEEKNSLQRLLDEELSKDDVHKLDLLNRTNAELERQVRNLKRQVDELEATKEQAINQVDNLQRLQIKQSSEQKVNSRSLELEKSSLKNQVDRLESELKNERDKETQIVDEMKTLQLENNRLKGAIQELEYKLKMVNCTIRMELTKQKGEVERERDRLAKQVESLNRDLEVAANKLEAQKLMFAEQEKENQRKLLFIQQEEWNKLHKTEKEKVELEAKLEDLERVKLSLDQEQRTAMFDWQKEKEYLEKQLNDLREKDTSGYENIKGTSLVDLRRELDAALEEKMQRRSEIESQRVKSERLLMEHQLTTEEQKSQLTNRISQLENQLSQLQIKQCNDNETNRNKIKKYRRGVVKLRNRLQLQQAKVDELETEREILKKNVPLDTHREIQKQLRQLQRKHDEFRNVMITSDVSETNLSQIQNQDDFSKHELQYVSSRISILDEKQKRQLMELDTNLPDSKHESLEKN